MSFNSTQQCRMSKDSESNKFLLFNDGDKLYGALWELGAEESSMKSTSSMILNENNKYNYAECE